MKEIKCKVQLGNIYGHPYPEFSAPKFIEAFCEMHDWRISADTKDLDIKKWLSEAVDMHRRAFGPNQDEV